MSLWYETTAVHFWHFYLRYSNADPERFSTSSRLNWLACDRAIKQFSDDEKEMLRHYYSTNYGNYEDQTAIHYLAYQNAIAQADIYRLIKKANYEVMVQRGLMDRKE